MQSKSRIGKFLDDLAQKRLFGFGPTEDWSYVDKFSGPSKDIKLLGMYRGITYRCIDTISEAMGRYQPYLYTMGAQGKETTVAKHPFIDLLHKPNPDLSMFQLFEGSASFVEQFGEFFWYMVPGSITGQPREIYLLRPDRVGIVIDKTTGEVIGYNYSNGNGHNIPFTLNEILHHMSFNPRNPYRGYGTVEAAIDYIQTEEEVSRFTRNYFKNNAAMSGVLNVAGKVGKEQWKKFVTQWRERYEGVENAGKVALVRDSQTTFTPTGSSLKDMNMTDLKETTLEQILMMFKVPKGILGMESGEGLGRASVETLEYIFAKWTIDGKQCRMDDTLQRAMDRYYPTSAFQVGHTNQIPIDKEYQLQVYTQGADKWLTRKEIRAADPTTATTVIPGDDQLFVPINMQPLQDGATLAEDKPKAPIPPELDPNNNDNDDDKNDDEDKNEDDDKEKAIVLVSKKKELKHSSLQSENFRSSLERNAVSYVETYKKGLNKLLSAQQKRVIANIGHLGKDLSDTLLDMADEDSDFQDVLAPILSSLVLEQGQLALEFAGDDSGEYDLSQAILNALTESTKRMSQNFNTATLKALNDSLTEGVANGESLSKLTQRVADVYQQATGYRAERVARTESLGASNAATLDAYRQTGYVTAMEWFANPDCCPYCAELDGTVVGLEDVFVNQGDSVDVTDDDGSNMSYQADYGDVTTPPLHPNCSCTIIPVTDAN